MKKFTSILLALIMLFTINTYAEGSSGIANPGGRLIVSVDQTIETSIRGIWAVPVRLDKSKFGDAKINNLSGQVSITNPNKAYIDGDGYLNKTQNNGDRNANNKIFNFV